MSSLLQITPLTLRAADVHIWVIENALDLLILLLMITGNNNLELNPGTGSDGGDGDDQNGYLLIILQDSALTA